MSEAATAPKRRKKKEQTAEPIQQQEVVVYLPLSELHPMPDAPYGVRDDEAMRSTARSIKENGVLTPAIVRPRTDGGYEIIAGNRRKHGAELAELATMPCIVRNLDDNEAISSKGISPAYWLRFLFLLNEPFQTALAGI